MRRRNLHLAPTLSRREAVTGLVASLAAGCAPKSGDDTGGSAAPKVGSVEHIIVLMYENRSFDHFLGALKLVEGRDVDGLDASMSNRGRDGTAYTPQHTDESCVYDPPHSWGSSHDQFNGGANDGFVREYEDSGSPYPGEVMNYLDRTDLPITYALADAYAVCDRYFCSVMGPTWPNRHYGHAGTSGGMTSNDYPSGGFTFPTVWQKLDEIGVPWKYYYTDVPFLGLYPNHLRAGFYGFIDNFVDDCAKGILPPVCWIDPGFTFNDHHPPHHVGLGEEFLALVYEALASSPLWEKCLLVVTFDEHGGFFDHVPPPTSADDHAADGFDQLGFRIPVLLIGPWVKQGVVSEVFDNTSWLKLVCEKHGIEPWTARIAAAASLEHGLDLDRMARGEPLPAVTLPAFDIDDESLPDDCFGGGLGPTPPPGATTSSGGQPELEAFIAAHFPSFDRREGALARFLALSRRERAHRRG